MWARWSRTVPRFPAVLAAAGLAVMVVVSVPVLHLRLGFADASNDPASSTTYKAYEMLAEGFGPGFNGPLLLVAQTQSAADRTALDRLDRALTAVPGVAAVETAPAQAGPVGRAGSRGDPGHPHHGARSAGHLQPDHPAAEHGHTALHARHHAAGLRGRPDRHVR